MMSSEKPKVIDRIYTDAKYDEFLDTSYIFGFETHDIERKDQFLFALSLGYKMGKPTPISGKKKRQLILTKYLDEDDDMPLLYAIAYAESDDINYVSKSDDALNYVYKLAEEYANTGLSFLKNFEENCSYENYLKKFEKKIKDHLKTIDMNED